MKGSFLFNGSFPIVKGYFLVVKGYFPTVKESFPIVKGSFSFILVSVFINVYLKLNSVLKTNCKILKYKNRIKSK